MIEYLALATWITTWSLCFSRLNTVAVCSFRALAQRRFSFWSVATWSWSLPKCHLSYSYRYHHHQQQHLLKSISTSASAPLRTHTCIITTTHSHLCRSVVTQRHPEQATPQRADTRDMHVSFKLDKILVTITQKLGNNYGDQKLGSNYGDQMLGCASHLNRAVVLPFLRMLLA